MRDIVEQICEVTGKNFAKNTAHVAERLGPDQAYVIDSSKARNQFDWQPKITIAGGLKRIVNWIDYYWDLIQHEELNYEHKA